MIESVLHPLLSLCAPGGAAGRLSILQFHRLPPPEMALPPGEMSQPDFERILDAISTRMTVLPLEEAVQALARKRLPPCSVCITFDDGYAEWLDFVAPALRRRGMHATFFITTGQLEGGGMWHERVNAAVNALPSQGALLPAALCGFGQLDQQRQRDELAAVLQEELKYLPVLERDAAIAELERQANRPLAVSRCFSADHVRELHAQGFGIGAHTVNHPILNRTSAMEAEHEIGHSREVLQGIVRAPVALFAYPNGRPVRDYSAQHIDMVKRCGYSAAVSTGGGTATATSDPYQLPRFTPWGPSKARSLFQIARNAWRPARERREHGRRTRVMVVENGAGFGGAITALQTLLRGVPSEHYDVQVVSNLPVAGFDRLPAVRGHQVINDEWIDFKPWAVKLGQFGPQPLRRAVTFTLGRADDLINRLPYLLALYRTARRWQPDVIHGNNEPYSNREAMIVAKLLQRPFIQHLRGPYPRMRHTAGLLQRPDRFIAVSRWLAERLVDDGVHPNKIRQIYDAVAVHPEGVERSSQRQGQLLQTLGLPEGTRLVAMVGMLLPWKGQTHFLEAALQIGARHPGVHFLVVGDAPQRGDPTYKDSLLTQVEQAGRQHQVHFLGHRSDVTELMPSFDLVVSASVNPEPLGLVMLEAMDAGAIFIGPRHGAAVEVIRDGHNGFLFEPGSASALAATIERALSSLEGTPPGGLSSIGQAGAQSVRGLFSPSTCLNKTLGVYEAHA